MLFTWHRPGTVAMASAAAEAAPAASGTAGAAFGGTADGFLESEKAHLRWVRGVGCMAAWQVGGGCMAGGVHGILP